MIVKRLRATGYYAMFQGREYHATVSGANVILRSYHGEAEPADFTASRIPVVQGIRVIERSELEQLNFVRTSCQWQDEPFVVVGLDGQFVYVLYVGNRGEWAVAQAGMVRTGKLETHGRLQITEVNEFFEIVDPLPL